MNITTGSLFGIYFFVSLGSSLYAQMGRFEERKSTGRSIITYYENCGPKKKKIIRFLAGIGVGTVVIMGVKYFGVFSKIKNYLPDLPEESDDEEDVSLLEIQKRAIVKQNGQQLKQHLEEQKRETAEKTKQENVALKTLRSNAESLLNDVYQIEAEVNNMPRGSQALFMKKLTLICNTLSYGEGWPIAMKMQAVTSAENQIRILKEQIQRKKNEMQ